MEELRTKAQYQPSVPRACLSRHHAQKILNRLLGERELEFSNALGSLYSKRSGKDRTAQQWLDKAIEAYENSLSIDSMNYEANYNLSMTYHNKGTGLLLEIQEDADIQTIEMVQRETLECFRRALFYRNRINR
jgi:predicted GNAT family N-acyltransferase